VELEEEPKKRKLEEMVLIEDDNIVETSSTKKPFKFKETVRNKSERDQLPGHECEHCKKFYDAVGIDDKKKFLNFCSRHKYQDSPPTTPENYWEVSFPDTETQG